MQVTKGHWPVVENLNAAQNDPEPGAWQVLAKYLRRPSVFLPLLGLTTLVLYSAALFFDFVWDDLPQIVNSPIIRSWNNLPRAFTSDLWYHVARHQVYYRPLFVAWSMLNYSIFGLRPLGWHLGGILSHIGAVFTVFWLARKLGLEYWTATIAALIFALHPVHIEPVVWVSSASDTMVTMFVALAFVAFLNSREREQSYKVAWWLASLVLLACALLTKEMAVTFAALVGIYAWLHPRINGATQIQRLIGAAFEALPYAAVTLAYMILRKHALAQATGQFDPSHGALDVLRTLPFVLVFYFQKLVLPVGLTGLYYTRYVTGQIVSHVVVPLFVLTAAFWGIWYWNKREGNSTVAFAGLWMLVGLAPALYLRNFDNGALVHDRYIYLPSVGFAILLATALRHLPSLRAWRSQLVQAVAVGLLCITYVAASLAQQVYWGNDLMVLVRGQSLYPDNPVMMAWLASEYSQRGANDQAIALARTAAIEHPDYGYGPLSLAEAYIRAGRFEEGRPWLEKINPEYVKSEVGMATVAGLYGRMGDYDKALALCSELLSRDPDLYSAIYNCGNIHLMAGQYAQAEQLLRRAVMLAPGQPAPLHFLGRALLRQKRNDEAQRYLQEAATIDPKIWDYHYWLGESFELSGNTAGARNEYRQALQLNQESADARLRLAALEAKNE